MKRNRTTTRKLHVESLERRCLLTGNVAVNVAGHTLILTGDNSDNTAVVSGTGNPGEYLVSDPTGTTNFRFQGTDNESVVVEGITDSIIVDLRNAPNGDAFGLTHAALRGSVIVNTGSGNDTVAIGNGVGLEAIIGTDITLGDVRLAGSIVIDTGKGDDLVDIGFANAGAAAPSTAVAVGGSVIINTQGDNDTVNLGLIDLTPPDDLIPGQGVTGPVAVAIRHDLIIGMGGSSGTGSDTVFESSTAVGGSEVISADGNIDVTLSNTSNVVAIGGTVISTDQGVDIAHNLDIHLGRGTNSLRVYDTAVGDTFNVTAPTSNNEITLESLRVRHNANIVLGVGNDTILVGTTSVDETTGTLIFIGGDFNIITAKGNTTIEEAALSVGGSENVNLGRGVNGVFINDDEADDDRSSNDTESHVAIGRDLNVNFGDGSATFRANDTSVGGNVNVIHGGGGDATVELGDVHVGRNILIITGRGSDFVHIEGDTTAQDLFIDTGSGGDDVEFDPSDSTAQSTFKTLEVFLGSGDDSLSLSTVVVTGRALLDGGPGNDTLTFDTGTNSFGKLRIFNFEHVNGSP
jgi:hypothetical protein